MENDHVNPRLAIVVLAAMAVLSACSTAVPATSEPPETADRSASSTLPARWWLWVESTGIRNPVADSSGRDCAVEQPADVWFLAGTYGGAATRTCTIPAGQPIYVPVMNTICEIAEQETVEAALAACDPQPKQMSAQLDGKNLEIVRATSEGAFAFTAGPESMIANPGDQFDAVASGHWIGPVDVAAGEHVLRFEAASDRFEIEVTYNLIVE